MPLLYLAQLHVLRVALHLSRNWGPTTAILRHIYRLCATQVITRVTCCFTFAPQMGGTTAIPGHIYRLYVT